MKTPLPWQFYALVIALSLLITRLGIPIGGILAALGVFVVAVIIWDKKWGSGKKTHPLSVTGRFEVITDATGYEELWLTLQNTSSKTVSLPQLAVNLAYTTFAGGTPALGGNGIDSVKLSNDMSLPQTLQGGATLRLPIDRASTALSPQPHQIKRAKNEATDVYAARFTRRNAAYATLCARLRAAPSLMTFLDQTPEAFVTAQLAGERTCWDYARPKGNMQVEE